MRMLVAVVELQKSVAQGTHFGSGLELAATWREFKALATCHLSQQTSSGHNCV